MCHGWNLHLRGGIARTGDDGGGDDDSNTRWACMTQGPSRARYMCHHISSSQQFYKDTHIKSTQRNQVTCCDHIIRKRPSKGLNPDHQLPGSVVSLAGGSWQFPKAAHTGSYPNEVSAGFSSVQFWVSEAEGVRWRAMRRKRRGQIQEGSPIPEGLEAKSRYLGDTQPSEILELNLDRWRPFQPQLCHSVIHPRSHFLHHIKGERETGCAELKTTAPFPGTAHPGCWSISQLCPKQALLQLPTASLFFQSQFLVREETLLLFCFSYGVL